MISIVVAALSSLLAVYILLQYLLQSTQDAREPPVAASTIPFISTMAGMAKQGKFYTELRDKYDLPIYTLRLPGSRLYILNSIKLIAAAQRQVRILDFAPIESRAAVNVMGASQEGKKLLHMNRNGVGEHSYAIEFDKAIHHAVSPGVHLDAMNKSSVQMVAARLDALASQAPTTIKLFEWVRKEIAWATTEAVYGPANPFRDPEIQEAFWEFEPGIVILLLQIAPSLLAKKNLQAREKVVRAFRQYFDEAGHEQGSELTRSRYQHSVDYEFSAEDIARFEIGGAVAILTNTIPTAFWLLWHISSNPETLEECRRELLPLYRTSGNDDTVTIDITEVKHSCPILVSALQEVLRFHGTGTSVRVVQEDHLLNGEYLLKKGGTVMIPGPVQHTSKKVYGENVNEFQPKRFVRTEGKRPNPAGFRGFGGGSTLCPGRHFVSTEIVAFVALMISRFDLTPVSGQWTTPTTKKAGMQATVPSPDHDIEVKVTIRKDAFAGKTWKPELKGSDKALEFTVEDTPGRS